MDTWYLLDENDDVDHAILLEWLRSNARDGKVVSLGGGELAAGLGVVPELGVVAELDVVAEFSDTCVT